MAVPEVFGALADARGDRDERHAVGVVLRQAHVVARGAVGEREGGAFCEDSGAEEVLEDEVLREPGNDAVVAQPPRRLPVDL